MDDLRQIKQLLDAPPPAPASVAQARTRLSAAYRVPEDAPQRRAVSPRWALAGAAVLVAAAVATAVGVTAGARPARPPSVGAGASTPGIQTPRDILLAAATSAEQATIGRYWLVQTIGVYGPFRVGTAPDQYNLVRRELSEKWLAHDPHDRSWFGSRMLGFRPRDAADQQAWRNAGSPDHWDVPADTTSGTVHWTIAPGKAQLAPVDAAPYLPGLGGLSGAQVQQLPTDPAALRGWLLARIASTPNPPVDDQGRNLALFSTLSQLLLDVPAPPKVRAAAFEVLAAIPGIRSLGQVADAEGRPGLGIELSGQYRDGIVDRHELIIDPGTHLILAQIYSARQSGQQASRPVKEANVVVVKAEWTDQTPVAPSIS